MRRVCARRNASEQQLRYSRSFGGRRYAFPPYEFYSSFSDCHLILICLPFPLPSVLRSSIFASNSKNSLILTTKSLLKLPARFTCVDSFAFSGDMVFISIQSFPNRPSDPLVPGVCRTIPKLYFCVEFAEPPRSAEIDQWCLYIVARHLRCRRIREQHRDSREGTVPAVLDRQAGY